MLQGAGWIDPCPFWDEDGKIYMVNGFAKSRIGFKSALYISALRWKGKQLVADSDEGGFVYDGHATQPTIEGPKLYKRNGYYYIFAPAGGVKTGWQTVLRSRNILGPYEEKIVLRQGNSSINGPHQGAWVDTPCGEDWFIHFQDVGTAGRIVHLQPIHWVDDWPVIGINTDENGCGEPVSVYKKPTVGAEYPIDALEDSDFFEGTKLGCQWQWNANWREDWYELGNDCLRLKAQRKAGECQLCNVSNLLLQKWPAPEFTITTCIGLEDMKEGDAYGLISLGGRYDSLLICQRNGRRFLQQRTGSIAKEDEICTWLEEFGDDKLYIRMTVERAERISLAIASKEEKYHEVGRATEARAGIWVGVKAGLVAVNENGTECGVARIPFFAFQPRIT